MPTKNAYQSGFTLLEIIAVLIIASVLFITIDLDFTDNTQELRGYAEQLRSDIRYTQALSMQRKERYRINLSADHYDISDRTAATTINHPATNETQFNLPNTMALSLNGAITNDYLVFDSLGEPYTTSSLPGTKLTAVGTITLTMGTESISLNVQPETASIQIQ